MRVTDFSFELPESLIAHYPMPERGERPGTRLPASYFSLSQCHARYRFLL